MFRCVIGSTLFGILVVLCAGCEVKGTVTDVATGEPIAGVSVGMDEPFLPFPHASAYSEKGRTDSRGRYAFTHNGISVQFNAKKQGYQTATHFIDLSPSLTLDVPLRSIADIRGTWNVTVTTGEGETHDVQFVFREEGLVWVDDGFEAGVVPLSPVAPEIVVADYVEFEVYYVIGYMEGTMTLSESGDRITGSDIIIEGVGINSYECTIEGEFESDRVDTYSTF